MSSPRPPMVLVILDGFGDRAGRDANAVRLARTPNLDALTARYPRTRIGTSGPDVGLPPGQMGNSEVGHLNFGAGRIAMMDISRIDAAVAEGSLARNPRIAHTVVDGAGHAAGAGVRVHAAVAEEESAAAPTVTAWGDEAPSCERAQSGSCAGEDGLRTRRAGSLPAQAAGLSPMSRSGARITSMGMVSPVVAAGAQPSCTAKISTASTASVTGPPPPAP